MSVRSFSFKSTRHPHPPWDSYSTGWGEKRVRKQASKFNGIMPTDGATTVFFFFFYDRKHRPHAFFQEETFDVVGHRGCLFYLQNENQSISPDQSRGLFTCQRSWFLRPQRRHFQHRLANTQTCVCDVYRSWPEVPPWGVEFRHEKVTVQTPIRARS